MKKIFNLGTSQRYPNEFCSHLREVYFGYFLDHIFCERKISFRELSIVTETYFARRKEYEMKIMNSKLNC